MTNKQKTEYNGWITTNPDKPELKLWPLVPGMYWVIFTGDSETVDGHVIYEFDDYQGIFTLRGHDEETGEPYGDEYVGGGCTWDEVVAYHELPIVEPEPYS